MDSHVKDLEYEVLELTISNKLLEHKVSQLKLFEKNYEKQIETLCEKTTALEIELQQLNQRYYTDMTQAMALIDGIKDLQNELKFSRAQIILAKLKLKRDKTGRRKSTSN